MANEKLRGANVTLASDHEKPYPYTGKANCTIQSSIAKVQQTKNVTNRSTNRVNLNPSCSDFTSQTVLQNGHPLVIVEDESMSIS